MRLVGHILEIIPTLEDTPPLMLSSENALKPTPLQMEQLICVKSFNGFEKFKCYKSKNPCTWLKGV
jgi:hypothetical protein